VARSGGTARGSRPRRKLTLVEARYPRCRKARYQGLSGGAGMAAARPHSGSHGRADEPVAGYRRGLAECAGFSRAPHSPRGQAGSGRLSPGLRARLTSVASPAALLGGSRCGSAESAAVPPIRSSEEISGSLPAFLPGSASATPIPTAFAAVRPGDRQRSALFVFVGSRLWNRAWQMEAGPKTGEDGIS
jgi:hypothetical protein